MLWIIGAVVVLSVLSTTPASRAVASQRLARWNPLFVAIIALQAAAIWYFEWGPGRPL